MLRAVVHRFGRTYVERLLARDASAQRFTRTNERPIEYRFVFEWLNRLQPTTVLDVGTGQSALPSLIRTCGPVVTAIDSIRGYWPEGTLFNRHWRVHDEDITKTTGREVFDLVLCVSVLEHITDPIAAMRGLHQRTAPNGHAIVTTPFGAMPHANVYTLPGTYAPHEPYICRQSSPADLVDWQVAGFDLIDAEYWRLFDSPYWSVGTLIRPPQRTEQPASLGCFVLRRR